MAQVQGITVIIACFTCSDNAFGGPIFQDIQYTIGETRWIRLTLSNRLNDTPVFDFASDFLLNILAKQIYRVGESCSDFLGIRLNLPIKRLHDKKTRNHKDADDYDEEYRTISEEDFVMEFVNGKDHLRFESRLLDVSVLGYYRV